MPTPLTHPLVKGTPLSMTQLSPKGLRAVEEIAHRTGFGQHAVTSMLFSIRVGRGGMAQFSHPEFGGSGQWMAGGAIMISDMFNNALKARVDGLCNELSALVRDEPDIAAAGSFPSQNQGARRDLPRGSSSPVVTEPDQANWSPADLGNADRHRAPNGSACSPKTCTSALWDGAREWRRVQPCARRR